MLRAGCGDRGTPDEPQDSGPNQSFDEARTVRLHAQDHMKLYVLTEAEKQALLRELELAKFHTPDHFCLTDEQKKAQLDAASSMHRRFHCIVCKALE
jgi:hypothetical protein